MESSVPLTERGSRRALARALGLAPSYIMKACKRGMIDKAIGTDNLLDFAVAVAELEASADPAAAHVRERWAKYRAGEDQTERAESGHPGGVSSASPGAPPAPSSARAEVDDLHDDQSGVCAAGAGNPDAKGAGPGAGGTTEGGEGNVVKFQEAKARKEHFQAQQAELDYLKSAGQLVDVEAVEKGAFNSARVLRESLQLIPDRLSQVLAAQTDPARIHEILSEEIEKALNDFAAAIDRQRATVEFGGR